MFLTVFRSNFRPEVDDEVISCTVAVDHVDMDVLVHVCDSRSAVLEIFEELIPRVTNERTNEHDEAYLNRTKGVSPEINKIVGRPTNGRGHCR